MPPKNSAASKVSKVFARAGKSYFVGAHVSCTGGPQTAIDNAALIGGGSFAMFLKNQRRWVQKPYESSEIEAFHELCKKAEYDPVKQVLPHSSYLINLGNPDDEKRAKAMQCFEDDLLRCEQLGIGLYNIHPGSALQSDKTKCIERIAAAINSAHEKTSFVRVVLENMAGHGNIIGSTLEDLKQIIDLIENKARIGVCIDTCHSFAAGYDLRTETTFNEFWKKFDKLIGYKYLSAMHLNDSKAPFDSKRDLHQNIGVGFLGLECFRLIMNKKELEGLPLILETPADDGEKNSPSDSRGDEIKLLEWLNGRTHDDPEFLEKSKQLQARGAKDRLEQQQKFEKKKVKTSAASGNRKLNFKRKRSDDDDGEKD